MTQKVSPGTNPAKYVIRMSNVVTNKQIRLKKKGFTCVPIKMETTINNNTSNNKDKSVNKCNLWLVFIVIYPSLLFLLITKKKLVPIISKTNKEIKP